MTQTKAGLTYCDVKNMMRMSLYPKRYDSSIISDDGTINYSKWRHLGEPSQANWSLSYALTKYH